MRRRAGRDPGEPLEPEDWALLWDEHEKSARFALHRLFGALGGTPRCGVCGAPFGGRGSGVARRMGFTPSRKNPTVCSMCVEMSPPGGMTMPTGVLFADVRGFTERSEGADPGEIVGMLTRFYGAAEEVLFPEAVIDKLIGDQVMALYLPEMKRRTMKPEDVPALMLGHDFTAIGDVVNTASRLQGQAHGGEIMCSERIATGLPEPPGDPVELELKGKADPEHAYRGSWREP